MILIAGLWPFHAPANAASWLKNKQGLHFGRYGTAVSQNPFQQTSKSDALSLEIWLKPAEITQQSAILAFDSSPIPRADFSLRQYGNSLAIQRYMIDDHGIPRRPWFKVDGVFREGQPVLLTITATQSTTTLYVDGAFKEHSSTLGLIPSDLTGRLVLANSMVNESWAGEIYGLAIYDRQLTPVEVRRHFDGGSTQWTAKAESDSPAALYSFDEEHGNTVRNKMDPETGLVIPERYFVLHPDLLRSFWDELNSGAALRRWSYWEDVALNIMGFVPLGFVFAAYLATVGGFRRAGVLVVIAGFCVSLMIEVLQRFLPTRNSGMTDLFTNTLGTAIGVVVFRLAFVQRLIARNWGSEIFRPATRRGGVAIGVSEPSENMPYSA